MTKYRSYYVYQRNTGSWAIAQLMRPDNTGKPLPFEVFDRVYETEQEARDCLAAALAR